MSTQLNFDATTVEPLQPMTALPKDRYNVMISDSEMKTTKAGDGEYLQLEFTVLDGPMANRKVWSRLNLRNQNATTEDISRRELAAICHAVGVMRVADSADLHDKPLLIDVIVEKGKDGGENNRIKAYLATEGAAPVTAKTAAKPAAAAKTAAPPWAKSKATA
jgi:hypothetical protein